MRSDCNLELTLLPANNDFGRQPPQKLTIFYNGQVCVFDATQPQVREILMLASKERSMSRPDSPKMDSHHQLCNPNYNNGLSMKRSLQRFLQKRKSRIQATSPYNLKPNTQTVNVRNFMY